MLRALVSGGRTRVDRAMDTSEEVKPRAQIELAEEELFKVAADGGAENTVKSFAQATTAAVKMAGSRATKLPIWVSLLTAADIRQRRPDQEGERKTDD